MGSTTPFTCAMDDETLSSVDQFLRDNGFSISESALGATSFSEDELLDEELMLSDAEERQTPRFVLLDEGLPREAERSSGEWTNERQQDAVGERERRLDQKLDLLDTSVFCGDSELSLSTGTPRGSSSAHEMLSAPRSVDSVSSASSMTLDLQLVEGKDSTPLSSVHRNRPQQKEMERVAMVSTALSVSVLPSMPPLSDSPSSSSISSRRVVDDELSDAVEVLRSSTGADRLSLSSREEGLMHMRRTAEDQNQQPQHLATFHTPRTQRTLFSDDGDVKCLVEKDVQHERAVRSKHHSDDHSSRWSEPRVTKMLRFMKVLMRGKRTMTTRAPVMLQVRAIKIPSVKMQLQSTKARGTDSMTCCGRMDFRLFAFVMWDPKCFQTGSHSLALFTTLVRSWSRKMR